MEKKKRVTSWRFEGKEGEFVLNEPHRSSRLYFPLANEYGMMSAITPLLNGDIKTSQDTYLMQPISVDDIHNTKGSRNFWIKINNRTIWSATGNSVTQRSTIFSDENEESVKLTAGFLWQKVERINKKHGVSSEIINFVPTKQDHVELMKVTIRNIGEETITITPTAAVPIYGRSAYNVRDHRHVTSLFHRIYLSDYGVEVNPTLTFDERGHKLNKISYLILGVQEDGIKPIGFYPIQEHFIGESGSLDWPEAIVKDEVELSKAGDYAEGFEAIGAIRFSNATLKANDSISYVIIMGISENHQETKSYIESYGSITKFDLELKKNNIWWKNKLSTFYIASSDNTFDLWMKWVEIQPVLRRIYGCSFLPHHDYGHGGRGWRDLWQDCLALLILDPKEVRTLLFNNYAGVRIDGSNATIIGSKPGEFFADRNNIPRAWMDHGAWPYYTTKLYLDFTGDLEFLLEQQVYFKDSHCNRSRKIDAKWTEAYGCNQKDNKGEIYKGSLLEHILLEQITMFYNVGEHNNIRIEDADWNDAYDMAADRGESVAFTAFYGNNLMNLSKLILSMKNKLGKNEIKIAKEILVLLDTITSKVDYDSVTEKVGCLERYFNSCEHDISGDKVKVDIEQLADDLRLKAEWIMNHILEQEWIENKEGYKWFNGYYDNDAKRLEGDFETGVRMTLTGQVFTIMGNVADNDQIKKIIESVNKYLRDEVIGGIRLNSRFDELKLNMGRSFGFAFGHKENGAMFSHMAIMYINALYSRGFVKDGFDVLKLIYSHACDFDVCRIYPGIPEYFNERGRGMYHYLTGAASWLLLTVRNEMYGIKGKLGDLWIEPKLVREQFDEETETSIYTVFREKKLTITYRNASRLEYGNYTIGTVFLDGQILEIADRQKEIIISQDKLDLLCTEDNHFIVIEFV